MTAAVDPVDRAAAVELLARYAEAIDDGDFAAVGALFAAGEIQDADGNLIAAGAAQVAALFTAMTRLHPNGTPLTTHLVTNSIVDGLGPDELRIRSRFVVFQATERVPLQPIVAGRYDDVVHRDADGSWRFTSRRMIPELWGDTSDHLLHDPTGQ